MYFAIRQRQAVRLSTLASLLLCAGCGQRTPRLQYVRIGLDEDNSPIVLGVELRNVGDTEVTVEGCSVTMLATTIFAATGSTGTWPEKFEHHVEPWETPEGRTLAPGESRVVGVSFVWELPPNAPQLIAVCKASFTIRYDASFKVATEEVMFVVASDADARQKILGEPFSNVKDAKRVADSFESFDGKRSPDVEGVIKLLREAADS